MDGTFQTVPSLFYQLYTIHGEIEDAYFPLVFGLLPQKTEGIYVKMFEKIREFLNVPKVQRIITDFELAVINACSLLFPSGLSHGCYFHYRQCVRRHLQTNGKQYLYDSDKDFHLFVKKLISIAFVPVEHVIRAFEAVCVASDIPEDAQSVVLYFENTWIGRKMPKREPKFRHSLWDFFDAIVQNFPLLTMQ